MLTGARSLIAISEWITDAPQHALGVLGFAADPLTGLRPVPHAATVRRLLQRVDGDALDAAIGAFLQARTPPGRAGEEGGAGAAGDRGRRQGGMRLAYQRPPRRSSCWRRWTTTAWSWPSGRSPPRETRSPPSHSCWTAWIYRTRW
ncbi:transposase family protein [Streptomyces sp. NPDC056002]|uniref:transposase family protein n=1 Tax=Streptomyces sp. NPDC056002 TaxID=3345675 RepID=UPI0035D84F9B